MKPKTTNLGNSAQPFVLVVALGALLTCIGLCFPLASFLHDVTRPDLTSHPMGLPIAWVLIWFFAVGAVIAGGGAGLIASAGLAPADRSSVSRLLNIVTPALGALASALPAWIYARKTIPRAIEDLQQHGWDNLGIQLIANLPVLLGAVITVALLVMAVSKLFDKRKTPPE